MTASRPILIAVAAILAALSPAVSVASSGGPDAAGYTWADSTEPTGPLYNYMFAANPLTTLGDDDSDVLTLGWNFPFYGTSYGQVEVHSNGVITFGTSALPISWINTCSLGPEAPIAAPFWDDFNPLSGGIVYYGNSGFSPNRVFVVEWYLMSNWSQTGNASFQVQLHEATGAVEFHYDDVDLSDPGGDDWGGDATVGTSGGGNTFQLSCLSPTLSNGFAVGFYPGPTCTDDDLDGYCDDVDCDDTNALVNPGQNEVCDGIDNDCDVSIDEGFDNDADGFTTCNGDCDDSNSLVNPGALEACNGVDDNCNGVVDDAPDVDNDGVNTCAGDCDDGDAANYPGNTEVCDGGDNNCDGTIDEGFDVDGDGVTTCGGDCDDNNGLISPAASEVCDGIDNNCNGEIDENADNDNDGVSNCDGDCDDDNPLVFPGAVEHCNEVDDDCDEEIDEGFDSDGDGWSVCGGDCNDNFDTVNPDAVEVCDGMDTDCDGEITDDQDLDLDGFTPCDDDCDDADPAVFPGAEEVLDDGIDQDCDGIDQTSSGTADDDDAPPGDDDDDAPPGDDDDVVSLGGGPEQESVGALGCTCGAEIASAEGTPMSWMLLLAAALGVSRRRFR